MAALALPNFQELGFSRWLGIRQLPVLDEHRQSNVSGLYVVGDLADAPVIKLALQQGAETGAHVAKVLGQPSSDPALLDAVIIGAGPAGLTAAMAMADAGMSYVVIERDAPFQTIHRFPKGKLIFADPTDMPTEGGLWFEDAAKEVLVDRWQDQIAERTLSIYSNESVTGLDGASGNFTVRTKVAEEGGHRTGPTPVDTDATAEATNAYRARAVILAIGRRGTVNKVGATGEDADKVQHEQTDPAKYANKRVLVVGGGDSAVETACSIADAGGTVHLSYRREVFSRPKPKNRKRLDASVAAGKVTLRTQTRLSAVREDAVDLVNPEGAVETLPNDAVFVMVGTKLPIAFLRKLGLQMESDLQMLRFAWLAGFSGLVWLFYLIKQKRHFFPFSEGFFDGIHSALKVPLPWFPTADGSMKVLDGGFWGSLTYTLLIVVFGILAYRKYPSQTQKNRYLSLMGFQVVFLFGIPEILAPLIISTPWKFYSLSVPWPLSLWSVAHEPAAWMWMAVGLFTSFVLMPLFVWRNGEKFCSYMCGCGGLAETLGDRWRHLAPRGNLAKKGEWFGVGILLAAIPVTLLIVNDMWELVGFNTWIAQEVSVEAGEAVVADADVPDEEGYMRVSNATVADGRLELTVEKFEWNGEWQTTGWIGSLQTASGAVYPEQVGDGRYAIDLESLPDDGPIVVTSGSSSLSSTSAFARHWYDLVVDFALASVLGVAFYPFLGNRVWCRFFCPLRAYMEILSRGFGRLAIKPNEKCISCGECTKYCQMGIDVQGFAQQQIAFDNLSSACIQCGICVEVCPVDCLSLVDKIATDTPKGRNAGARWGV